MLGGGLRRPTPPTLAKCVLGGSIMCTRDERTTSDRSPVPHAVVMREVLLQAQRPIQQVGRSSNDLAEVRPLSVRRLKE